jgi:hypothetical protein
MMRRAVEGGTLTSTCVPYELQERSTSYRLGAEQPAISQEGEDRDLKANLRYNLSISQ